MIETPSEYGINIRSRLKAGPGKTFVISDLSQIEPRCQAYLCKEWAFLEGLRSGISPYIIHGRLSMGLGADETWAKNDLRYKLAKIRVLALGYACGWEKFLHTACNEPYNMPELFEAPCSEEDHANFLRYLEIIKDRPHLKLYRESPPEQQTRFVNSWKIVTEFRKSNPVKTTMWQTLDIEARRAAAKGEDYEIELPGGHIVRYRKCRFRTAAGEKKGQVIADVCKQGRIQPVKIYGGLIFENITQAFARDVFRDAMLRVIDAGYKVVMHVHDELEAEIDEDDHQNEHRMEIERLMSVSPEWCKALPVAAESQISKIYTK